MADDEVAKGNTAAESARRTKAQRKSLAPGTQWLFRIATQCLALLLTIVLGIVLVGIAQRIGWIRSSSGSAVSEPLATKATLFTCPMHPEVRQDAPGECPICGMQLVPLASPSSADAGSGSTISTSVADRYICPMMCTPPQAEPGKCPVCAMELVKATPDVPAVVSRA